MCDVLKLNRSSFYKWVHTREKRRLKMCSDALIGERITTIFDDEHGLYGAKRIAASLNDDTDFGPTNHKKVARISDKEEKRPARPPTRSAACLRS